MLLIGAEVSAISDEEDEEDEDGVAKWVPSGVSTKVTLLDAPVNESTLLSYPMLEAGDRRSYLELEVEVLTA